MTGQNETKEQLEQDYRSFLRELDVLVQERDKILAEYQKKIDEKILEKVRSRLKD